MKPLIGFLWFQLALVGVFALPAQAQQTPGPQPVFADTAGTAVEQDSTFYATLYEIEHLRLERWIRENPARFTDAVLLKEVAQLKKEAENFAEKGDFYLATTWLETIWGLLHPEEEPPAGDTLAGSDGFELAELAPPPSSFSWSREIVTGVDLWRHQFQFEVPQVDVVTLASTLTSFEASGGNPYTGVRFTFDYARDRTDFHAFTSFRYSRDYLSGEVDLRLNRAMGPAATWKLQNRFSGNSFYRDQELRYFQNATILGFDFRRIGPFAFNIEDEFLIRRYGDEINTYPNYWHNAFKSSLALYYQPRSRIRAGYRNVSRIHPKFEVNDYRENRLDFSWYQALGREAGLSLENEYRIRDYTNVEVDTFFQDYKELYVRGTLLLPASRAFGLELEGAATRRDYRLLGANSLPDYWFWELEPELYVRVASDWRVGLGAVYQDQSYEEIATRLVRVGLSEDAALGIVFEDYYAYGPVVTIELFKADGFLLSLQESFLFQRHPNQLNVASDFASIYQDRNINSILLFLSWTVASRWRFTAVANLDDERSRRNDNNDSQNTIVGLEVNYTF